MYGDPSRFNKSYALDDTEVDASFDGRQQLTPDESEAWSAWEEAMPIMQKLGFHRWTQPRLVPATEQYGDKASIIFEILLEEPANTDMARWILRREFEANMTSEACDRLTFAVANAGWW